VAIISVAKNPRNQNFVKPYKFNYSLLKHLPFIPELGLLKNQNFSNEKIFNQNSICVLFSFCPFNVYFYLVPEKSNGIAES